MVKFWLSFSLYIADILASPLSVPFGAHPWAGSDALIQASNALCFSQRQPHDVQYKPIRYMDCIEAAERATAGGKAGAPMHFSRHPSKGMELPQWWTYGSCTIRIDMKEPDEEDTFPMYGVANAASKIAEDCTKPNAPGLGGLGLIGPKKVVIIIVYGVTPPPPPRPRPTIAPVAASV